VRGGGDLYFVEASGHELQPRHLCGGVLHGDPVGVHIYVGDSSFEFGGWVVEVVDEYFFGQGE
jgi:hypothetical protein